MGVGRSSIPSIFLKNKENCSKPFQMVYCGGGGGRLWGFQRDSSRGNFQFLVNFYGLSQYIFVGEKICNPHWPIANSWVNDK